MASEFPYDLNALKESYVGSESLPTVLEVEKGHVRAFAEAIEDANPLWVNETFARQTSFGGIIVPPTFLRVVSVQSIEELPDHFPFKRLLDGGSEWEYLHPIRIGDTITAVSRIADLYGRTGRLGPMVFIVSEITYTNQLSQVVAIQKSTSIRY